MRNAKRKAWCCSQGKPAGFGGGDVSSGSCSMAAIAGLMGGVESDSSGMGLALLCSGQVRRTCSCTPPGRLACGGKGASLPYGERRYRRSSGESGGQEGQFQNRTLPRAEVWTLQTSVRVLQTSVGAVSSKVWIPWSKV